jgi:hypothetical protein
MLSTRAFRYARENTALADLRDYLIRLENLSYILVWTKAPKQVGENCTVDLIELPRLQLTFSLKGTHFFSNDHTGLFLSNYRSELVKKNLRGIPSACVLENAEHALSILVPNVRPVRPQLKFDPLSTRIIFDRANAKWTSGRKQRHFLFPVHLSRAFITMPSPSASLYMLLLRLMNRQYEDAFRLCETCMTDSDISEEELNIFEQLQFLKNDKSPNAHAVRLKLSLVTMDTPSFNCDWSITQEMEGYLSKQMVWRNSTHTHIHTHH